MLTTTKRYTNNTIKQTKYVSNLIKHSLRFYKSLFKLVSITKNYL